MGGRPPQWLRYCWRLRLRAVLSGLVWAPCNKCCIERRCAVVQAKPRVKSKSFSPRAAQRKPGLDIPSLLTGEVLRGEAGVPDQLYLSLVKSKSLPILYLPADPTANHPAAWEWPALSDSGSFVAPFILAIPAVMLLQSLRAGRRLVAVGLPVVGVVTRCSPERRGGFSVTYDFQSQDGGITKGSGWSRTRLEAGTNIWVLYLQRNPPRNEPYPSLNYVVVQ
jgi:hypothetical protein